MLTTLLYALQRTGLKRGIATLCLGGGNGVAHSPIEVLCADEPIKTVGVIGAGTMGNGIAQVFAQAGFDVRLARRRAGRDRSRADDDRQEPREVRREGQADRRRPRRRRRADSTAADARRARRRRLRRRSHRREPRRQARPLRGARRRSRPDAILASNTSSISITTLGAATKRPDKVLGMHFMNPVPLMALVEVIRGQATSDASMDDRHRTLHRARQDAASKPPTIPASSRTAS